MQQDSSPRAWRLIRDEIIDGASEEELDALVDDLSRKSATPYADLVARLIGIGDLDESEASALFHRIVAHRRALSTVLGRTVHIGVAALDLLSLRPARPMHRRSQPILVTPALIDRVVEEASADTLTGLPQRAQFLRLVRHELLQRKRRSVAVGFIDLDGFKEVNDVHGHARGDAVLRLLADAGRIALRQGDSIARIGGDEFVVLLLDVTIEEAQLAVLRLRERFEESVADLGTSFSFGVVVAHPRETAEDVLSRADGAMYFDKRRRAEEKPRKVSHSGSFHR